MKRTRFSLSIFVISIVLALPASIFAVDIEALLKDGKSAIENGQYEQAVNRLGELVTASGDKTNDDRIVALGSTVQAYGLWKMNNPQSTPMVIIYLNNATARDPSWEYPKKLLKEVTGKK